MTRSEPCSARPQAATRVYSHAEKMQVIGGILVCILLAAMDQTVVLPAIPQMGVNLHGTSHLSWVVSAYLLTATATTPIYGKLSDQYGRRTILVPAMILFILTSVGCAMANSVFMLIMARGLQGVGGGALMAVSQSAIADVISPRERGKYQVWFTATWAFASVAGPIAGGFVAQNLSWRWIFWANIPLGLLALALSIRGLAGLRTAGSRGRIDYLGAALLLAGVAALLAGLSTGGVDYAWLSLPVLLLFLAGLAAFALLLRQQRYVASPLFPGRLLGDRKFQAVIAVAFLNSATMFAGIFLLPLQMQWLHHASPAASGLEVVPFLLLSTIGSYVAGHFGRRIGRPKPIIIVGEIMGLAGLLPLAAMPAAGGVILPMVLSAVFGLGIGMVMPTTLVAAQSQSAMRDIGVATGMLLLLRAMGGAFGATIVGALLALSGSAVAEGFGLGFFAAAILLGIAMLIATRMEDFTLRNTLDFEPAIAD